MSAVEEIQAAIDKLTALAERNSTPGPWFLAYEGATHPRIWGNPDDDGAGADHVATMARFAGDADLIVTLHRTIDAQIKLLSNTLDIRPKYAELGMEARWISAVERAGDLDLARAINGKETK